MGVHAPFVGHVHEAETWGQSNEDRRTTCGQNECDYHQ